MITKKIPADRKLAGAKIALSMKAAGLDEDFIAAVIERAWMEEGILDLLELWRDEPSERDSIVADLHEHLEDQAEVVGVVEKPKIPFDELDRVATEVMAFKKKLRDLIDRNGGVAAVARKSGVPQPSLSRILSSASMPRRTTLYRIARALDLPESEIVTEWTS